MVRSLLGGAACGVVLALALVCALWYTRSPNGWNAKAIRARSVKAEPITKLNEQLKDESSGVIFSVDLENTTSRDITLPKSVMIMQQTKSSHALHDSFLEMDKDVFIPARHRVSISLDASGLCVPDYDPQICFNSGFGSDEDIVLLDSVTKYEIDIPIPALTIPPKGHGNLLLPKN